MGFWYEVVKDSLDLMIKLAQLAYAIWQLQALIRIGNGKLQTSDGFEDLVLNAL